VGQSSDGAAALIRGWRRSVVAVGGVRHRSISHLLWYRIIPNRTIYTINLIERL
jgi:hypothetical protein